MEEKRDFLAFWRHFRPFGGFLEVLWPFGGILSLLEAFCMVLWVFDGNMVGKWTNEPCNGADEVVNHFWVLTSPLIKNSISFMFRESE